MTRGGVLTYYLLFGRDFSRVKRLYLRLYESVGESMLRGRVSCYISCSTRFVGESFGVMRAEGLRRSGMS